MKIIDAAGADGRSILPDLQGASPAGLVTSDSWPCERISVGHLVRHHGWSVVGGIVHDGITGMCRLALIDADGEVSTRTLYRGQSDEVRTDAMISPDSLYKVPRRPGEVPALGGAAPPAAGAGGPAALGVPSSVPSGARPAVAGDAAGRRRITPGAVAGARPAAHRTT